MAPAKAPRCLVFQQRDVSDEVAARQLGLDDGAVALALAVGAGVDRAQVVAVGHLDKAEAIKQLTDERGASTPG